MLLRSLLKVTEVNTKHQKWPKIRENNQKKAFFGPKKVSAVVQSPPQELEVSPRSGLYLLVIPKHPKKIQTKSKKNTIKKNKIQKNH